MAACCTPFFKRPVSGRQSGGGQRRSPGLIVAELVTGVDLDAGQSIALRPCGPASQDTESDAVHSAVAALLPARGLTVDSIAEVLAECSATAGKPVVAAFTGILDPSISVEGMLGSQERAVPCFSNPGAAVAALAAVARYSEWVSRDQGHFVEPEGCDPGCPGEIGALLRDVRGSS